MQTHVFNINTNHFNGMFLKKELLEIKRVTDNFKEGDTIVMTEINKSKKETGSFLVLKVLKSFQCRNGASFKKFIFVQSKVVFKYKHEN